MLIKGFKFGMILQLAIGPMCLMVFNTSSKSGFLLSLPLIASIALVDALFIVLSCAGAAAFIGKQKVRLAVKIFGSIVLILFGADIIMKAIGFSILPNINIFTNLTYKNIFIQGFLLTASNPLTIIFWSGVFSTQAAENNMNKKQLFLFGSGCVLSTLLFQTAVAVLGAVLKDFLPLTAIMILNITAGACIIFFGIKMLIKKQTSEN